MHADGSFVGRSAPEIDVLEAQVSRMRLSELRRIHQTCLQMQGDPKNGIPYYGQVSQSAQWAVCSVASVSS